MQGSRPSARAAPVLCPLGDKSPGLSRPMRAGPYSTVCREFQFCKPKQRQSLWVEQEKEVGPRAPCAGPLGRPAPPCPPRRRAPRSRPPPPPPPPLQQLPPPPPSSAACGASAGRGQARGTQTRSVTGARLCAAASVGGCRHFNCSPSSGSALAAAPARPCPHIMHFKKLRKCQEVIPPATHTRTTPATTPPTPLPPTPTTH